MPRAARPATALAATPLALAALLLASGRPEARPGDIVRVERPRGSSGTRLRVCPLNPVAQERLTCYGKEAPVPGTAYRLIDGTGAHGRVVARRVEPSAQDDCRLGYAHDVFVDGDLTLQEPSVSVLAIQGLEGGDRARVLAPRQRAPSGRADEQVWMAIDRDGDELADVLGTYRECPDEPGAPTAPPGKMLQALCLDYWELQRGEWRRTASDVFFTCR